MKDETKKESHPSYGMLRFNRVNGQVNLFGVDYPQGHYMTLTLETGNVERRYGEEWFYSDKMVVEVAMSEVQFARLVASPNSSGVPCTIVSRHTEGFQRMPPVPKHMADAEKVKNEFARRGKEMSSKLDEARDMLSEMTKPGNSPNKQKVNEVLAKIAMIQRNLSSDMPFYIEQMQNEVDRTTNEGKAEVEAYAQHVMTELGKEALGEKIRSGGVPLRIGAGNTQKAIGHETNEDNNDG